MKTGAYEHQTYDDSDLPFIYHRDIVRKAEGSFFHWHEHLELLHTLSGEGTCLCGGVRYPMRPGTVIVVNADLPHSFFAAVGMEYDCLILHHAFCAENGADPAVLCFSPCLTDPVVGSLHTAVCDAFCSEGAFRTLNTRAAVLQLLCYLCREQVIPSDATVPSVQDNIKAAAEYARAHLAEPVSLVQAAAAAGLSQYYFAREFRRMTGQTFVTYLRTVRCDRAAQLLRDGATVTEACFACGFHELGYFSRTFRKITGVSPSSLRPSR